MDKIEYAIAGMYSSLAQIKSCAMHDYDNPQRALILGAASILQKQLNAFKIAMEAVK